MRRGLRGSTCHSLGLGKVNATDPILARVKQKTVISDVVMPSDANVSGTMFGGHLMALMDKAAYIVSSTHARRSTVTAGVDVLRFRAPIKVSQVVEIEAGLAYVGRTSMDVKIDVFALETVSGTRTHCCTGYFTMVAVDEAGRPAEVPPYSPRTEDERREFEAAKERRERLRGR